jgi:hypothetical protein
MNSVIESDLKPIIIFEKPFGCIFLLWILKGFA